MHGRTPPLPLSPSTRSRNPSIPADDQQPTPKKNKEKRWIGGSVDTSVTYDGEGGGASEEVQWKREEDFDAFAASKAQALVDATIQFKIHVVKDHDMKERLCLEIERLGPNTVIIGSRGFKTSRKNATGRHHCLCPVVVMRNPMIRLPALLPKFFSPGRSLKSPTSSMLRKVGEEAVRLAQGRVAGHQNVISLT